MVEPIIINNMLKWDGSHLGSYRGVLTHIWMMDGIKYHGITLPDYNNGIIYCTAVCTKDVFPCIVEDIKDIFGLTRRGIHRITIDNKEYILYYVPISSKGQVFWETPLNRLDSKHILRRNLEFKKEVRKIIAFCDILALSSTGEPSIRIRHGSEGKYIPISVNESATTIVKFSTGSDYDYSILSKTLFSKWFGEEISINHVVKDIITSCTLAWASPTSNVPMIINPDINANNLVIISSEIRNRIDEIIRKYDSSYIWYSYFIIDRMSRHLLIDS